MTHRTTRVIARTLVAAALVLVTTEAAFAQAAMPQQQVLGDVPYLNGGAGDEEVQYMKQSMKDYTLALAFSRTGSPRAEYVASVSITVKDAKGVTVFEEPSVGPYLLLKVPAGKYSVVASYQDVTQTRPVTAGKTAGTLTTFMWK
jgi:hypothetical protein